MKMCVEHWKALKNAIIERGMGQFIAQGNDAVARVQRAQEKEDATTFEPLLAAYMNITQHAISLIGLSVMVPDDDGAERCPICYGVAHCGCGRGEQCDILQWITYAADAELGYAKELGLVATN